MPRLFLFLLATLAPAMADRKKFPLSQGKCPNAGSVGYRSRFDGVGPLRLCVPASITKADIEREGYCWAWRPRRGHGAVELYTLDQPYTLDLKKYACANSDHRMVEIHCCGECTTCLYKANFYDKTADIVPYVPAAATTATPVVTTTAAATTAETKDAAGMPCGAYCGADCQMGQACAVCRDGWCSHSMKCSRPDGSCPEPKPAGDPNVVNTPTPTSTAAPAATSTAAPAASSVRSDQAANDITSTAAGQPQMNLAVLLAAAVAALFGWQSSHLPQHKTHTGGTATAAAQPTPTDQQASRPLGALYF